MKTLIVVSFMLLSTVCFSQTHITVNKEKCWKIRSFTDVTGETFVVVVVETHEIRDEKIKIEKILAWKTKAMAEDRLRIDGFRVEVYRNEDLNEISNVRN